MAENTKISWADDSVNLWWGCLEVGPGCEHCYARTLAERYEHQVWGPLAPRRIIESAFSTLEKLERKAVKEGRPRLVFVNSMSDLAEILPDEHPQRDSIEVLRHTFFAQVARGAYEHLRLIWLTKRIGNVPKVVFPSWMQGSWPSNLWLVATVCNQVEADRDIPKLIKIPATVRGLSIEPMLGPIDLDHFLYESCSGCDGLGGYFPPYDPEGDEECRKCEGTGVDRRYTLDELQWVICGGESGPNARPFNPQDALDLMTQCKAAEVPFFFKQMGSKPFDKFNSEPVKILDSKGHDWIGYDDLRIRQFPGVGI